MKAVKNEDFQPFSLRVVSGESTLRGEIELEYLFVYARDSDAVQMAIYSLCLWLCFFSLSVFSFLYAIHLFDKSVTSTIFLF